MYRPITMEYGDADRDHLVLEGFRRGDEKAFEVIFHRYYKRICLYAENFAADSKEAEDIAGEGFLRIWNGKRDFDSLNHLKASLYQATRHVGINQQVSTKRTKVRLDNYHLSNKDDMEGNQLQQIVYSEVMDELYRAVNLLPEKARIIIVETYIEGKSNQEVADQLGISIQTVKNQKLRALSLLRNKLRKPAFQLLISGQLLFQTLY